MYAEFLRVTELDAHQARAMWTAVQTRDIERLTAAAAGADDQENEFQAVVGRVQLLGSPAAIEAADLVLGTLNLYDDVLRTSDRDLQEDTLHLVTKARSAFTKVARDDVDAQRD